MAEIPIERKASKTWVWALLGAAVLLALLWWLFAGRPTSTTARDTSAPAATTPP